MLLAQIPSTYPDYSIIIPSGFTYSQGQFTVHCNVVNIFVNIVCFPHSWYTQVWLIYVWLFCRGHLHWVFYCPLHLWIHLVLTRRFAPVKSPEAVQFPDHWYLPVLVCCYWVWCFLYCLVPDLVLIWKSFTKCYFRWVFVLDYCCVSAF